MSRSSLPLPSSTSKHTRRRSLLSLLGWLCGSSLLLSSARPLAPSKPLSLQGERDMLYAWLAYAVVYQDWQATSQPDSSRGFNIGSVLVNANGYVVHWGRNSVNATRNLTQHGEVRLVQGYLRRTRQFALKGYTVYSTLEPCAMCSGMLTLTQVSRVVYGQRDPAYGDALQRLQLDSRACAHGYAPYPRAVTVAQAPDSVSTQLDADYRPQAHVPIVRFLATTPARHLYAQAAQRLAQYRALYPANQVRLDSARRYLAHIPTRFTE